MIHNNAATEMCITKGQEAIVYGWRSHKSLSGNDNSFSLHFHIHLMALGAFQNLPRDTKFSDIV